MSSGVLAGFPVVDVRATLYDGSYHDVDSSVLAFQIAARAAFREGMRKGKAQLLEPIMKVPRSIVLCCRKYRVSDVAQTICQRPEKAAGLRMGACSLAPMRSAPSW